MFDCEILARASRGPFAFSTTIYIIYLVSSTKETTMRGIIVLIFSALFIVAVNIRLEQTSPVFTSKVSHPELLATIQKAQDNAERVHLGEKLTEAGTNLKKLKEVYEAAVRLDDKVVANKADQNIVAIVLPRVREYKSKHIIQKYLKRVPKGSPTEAKLLSLLKEAH